MRSFWIPLLDWLDRDDIERIHGAESEYYGGLETPYSCANGTLQTLDQLAMVKGYGKGLSTEDGRRVDLTPYVTLYTDGKVNINTAPPEVLQCLSEQLDSAMAKAIADYRKTQEFRSLRRPGEGAGLNADLLTGVSPWVTFKSSAMSVESRGTYRDASRTVRAVVVRLRGQEDAPAHLLEGGVKNVAGLENAVCAEVRVGASNRPLVHRRRCRCPAPDIPLWWTG